MGGGGETSMASCLCCEIHSTQDLAILQKASSVCKKVSQRYILASSINLCISELDNFFFAIWLCCFRYEYLIQNKIDFIQGHHVYF